MSVTAGIGASKASRALIVVVACLMSALAHAGPTRAHTGQPENAAGGPHWYGLPSSTKPTRIVSLAPSTTEILFAIGAGPRVVAVTRYCDYPPEVSRLPKLGGVMDLNVEAVLAAKPGLVVAIATNGAEQALRRLGELGVPVLVVPSDRLSDFAPAVSAIADATGDAEVGKRVVATFSSELAALRVRAAKQKAITTVILVAERPLVAAGRGSFIDGAVSALGLVNVAPGTTPFPEIGREALLKANPELILDLTETGAPMLGQARLLRSKDPRLLRLSPRLPAALADLARVVGLP